MRLVLEQLFYGRGERGYGILGTSPGCREIASRVESLCGTVGTPNADYGGEPFLLSVPDGDFVIMLCGRRGSPDSMGRSTLFFHALVATRIELADAKADAFSLFFQGLFLDRMPTDDISTVSVDVKTDRASASHSRVAVSLPCVFRSEKPLLDSVRDTVGEQVNDLSWSTYGFQAMTDYDVQVLPHRVSCPRNVNEYDETGKLVRSAAAEDNSTTDEMNHVRSNETQRFGCVEGQTSNPPPKGESSAMLKMSVFVNIVLVAVCVVLLVSRKSTGGSPESLGNSSTLGVVTNVVERVVEKPVFVPLSDAQKAEIVDAAIKSCCDKIPEKSKSAFANFEATAVKVFKKYYGPGYTGQKEFQAANQFLIELRDGIKIVNEEVIQKTQKKGKTP